MQPSKRVSINGGLLTINETNSKDTATYTCVAENGLDNDTATATLQVKGEVQTVTIVNFYFSTSIIVLQAVVGKWLA